MATYFESINDFLTVQINDDFTNYALWKKGRCRGANGPASTSVLFNISFPLSPSGSFPIIVFDTSKAQSVGVLALSQSFKNGMAFASVYGSSLQVPAASQELDYYVYLPASDLDVSVQARGLFTLWNADGRVVYDSEANYLKVVDWIDFNYAEASYSKTYTVQKVGVVVSRAQWFVDTADSPGGWRAVAGATILQNVDGVPNRITATYTPFRYTTFGTQWPNVNDSGNRRRNQTLSAMICDISNLESMPYDIVQ